MHINQNLAKSKHVSFEVVLTELETKWLKMGWTGQNLIPYYLSLQVRIK